MAVIQASITQYNFPVYQLTEKIHAGAAGELMEKIWGIARNNSKDADSQHGELKSFSVYSHDPHTLFSKNPGKKGDGYNVSALIREYAKQSTRSKCLYCQGKGHRRLSLTLTVGEPTNQLSNKTLAEVRRTKLQGFDLKVDGDEIELRYNDKRLLVWSAESLSSVAANKINKAIVFPNAKIEKYGNIYYGFGKPVICSGFSQIKFKQMLVGGSVVVEIGGSYCEAKRSAGRNTIHDHGTKFRIAPSLFSGLYDNTIITDMSALKEYGGLNMHIHPVGECCDFDEDAFELLSSYYIND